jgi:hypothetical protein
VEAVPLAQGEDDRVKVESSTPIVTPQRPRGRRDQPVASRLDVHLEGTYVRRVRPATGLTEERLASLYEGDGFGGEKTMRAKVIRELIDEVRLLRRELADRAGSSRRDAS